MHPRLPPACTRLACLLALLLAPASTLEAQDAWRQRGANGQWVFTDGASATGAPTGDAISLSHEHAGPHLSLERSDTDSETLLTASNSCLCVISLKVSIDESTLPTVARGTSYQATLQPGEWRTLLHAHHEPGVHGVLRFSSVSALGAPGAVHRPKQPYRAPFAVGASFAISQAWPVAITHSTPDSRYAVDFALPDGTPVFAAREGTVINVRHDSFRGGAEAAMLDQANLILILHEDGTIGAYGHLHWDSIRVHIGQHVARGEYIANSGNTGFTTGPHLHFAVWRNAGTADVSVPVQFAADGGVGVAPATSMLLTAY